MYLAIVDTSLFFSISFYGTGVPWVTLSLGDLMVKLFIALLMLIPLTKALLQLNFFKEIVKPIPAALPRQSNMSRLIFWTIFFLSASIACVTFIPMVDIAKVLFVDAANRELTWYFPQRMNNSVMLWAAFNGTIGIIIFLLSFHLLYSCLH